MRYLGPPPITHPMGSGWRQPDPSRMAFDETHVVLFERDFFELHEYSTSLPSGVYGGKMWRRHDGAHLAAQYRRQGVDLRFAPEPAWLVCWFEPCADPSKCAVATRKVLLV